MPRNKITLTADSLRKMKCPEDKRRIIFYDKTQPKLACVVSKTGIKTFALHAFDRRTKKPLQLTIGRYPDISVNHARDQASKLLAQIADGIDIKEERNKIRAESTLDDLYQRWHNSAKHRKRTIKDDERTYELHIKPYFGKKRISSLTTSQVRSWHSKLSKKPRQRKKDGQNATLSQSSANRCLALLRSIYNAEAPEIPNPCKGVKQFKESSRDRFIRPHEMNKFFEALESQETPDTLKDLIKVMLFTGARRMNVFSMRWSELDLDAGIWTIPASKFKTGEKSEIELIPLVVDILKKRKRETSSVFVFPARSKTGFISDPKKQWKKLIERAGLSNLRMHDLRRTCGSYQAIAGSSLLLIGKSLGHRNMKTTEVYARVDSSPIRKSMEAGAEKIIEAALKTNKIKNI